MTDSILSSTEIFTLHAELCAALADTRRVMIMYALAERPYTVGELSTRIATSQPATSRHLKILREAGLVQFVRQGASIEYTVANPKLIEILGLCRQVLYERAAYRASLLEFE